MVKVILGDEVKDSLTGFIGVATGRADYLTGCARIQVEAREAEAGGKPGEHWFDEQRLEIVKRASYDLPEEVIEQAPAGPRNAPPARNP